MLWVLCRPYGTSFEGAVLVAQAEKNGKIGRNLPSRRPRHQRTNTAPRHALTMFARALLRRSGRQLRQLHTMPEHPHKGTVAALLHQRPFQRVELPSMVSSITMMPSKWQATLRGCDHALYSAEGNPTPLHIRASAPEQYEADYSHLCKLCAFFHVQGPPHGATFFTTDLGGACKLRWERHTEAQTYTFTRPAVAGEQADPFAESNVALSVI